MCASQTQIDGNRKNALKSTKSLNYNNNNNYSCETHGMTLKAAVLSSEDIERTREPKDEGGRMKDEHDRLRFSDTLITDTSRDLIMPGPPPLGPGVRGGERDCAGEVSAACSIANLMPALTDPALSVCIDTVSLQAEPYGFSEADCQPEPNSGDELNPARDASERDGHPARQQPDAATAPSPDQQQFQVNSQTKPNPGHAPDHRGDSPGGDGQSVRQQPDAASAPSPASSLPSDCSKALAEIDRQFKEELARVEHNLPAEPPGAG